MTVLPDDPRGKTRISDKALKSITISATQAVPGTLSSTRILRSNFPLVTLSSTKTADEQQQVTVCVRIAVIWPSPVTTIASMVRRSIQAHLHDIAGITDSNVDVIVEVVEPEAANPAFETISPEILADYNPHPHMRQVTRITQTVVRPEPIANKTVHTIRPPRPCPVRKIPSPRPQPIRTVTLPRRNKVFSISMPKPILLTPITLPASRRTTPITVALRPQITPIQIVHKKKIRHISPPRPVLVHKIRPPRPAHVTPIHIPRPRIIHPHIPKQTLIAVTIPTASPLCPIEVITHEQ